jgi:DNA-binding MarR family transcriptional regulator
MSSVYYHAATLDPQRSIGFLIKRCGLLMTQLAEREFQAHGMSFTQWLVLARLHWYAPRSATQLSEDMGHDMGALTRVVDTLMRAGLVRRERSRRDRRAVEIALTAEGRRAVASTLPVIVNALNRLVEPFSKNEIQTLIALLQRLLARLESLVGGARLKVRTAPSPRTRSASRAAARPQPQRPPGRKPGKRQP